MKNLTCHLSCWNLQYDGSIKIIRVSGGTISSHHPLLSSSFNVPSITYQAVTMKSNKTTSTSNVTCSGCNLNFPSKNQLFRHLADSTKTCLSPAEYIRYLTDVPTAKKYWEKIAVLYGYLPGTDYRFGCKDGNPRGIEGGQVN